MTFAFDQFDKFQFTPKRKTQILKYDLTPTSMI